MKNEINKNESTIKTSYQLLRVFQEKKNHTKYKQDKKKTT